MRTGSLSVKTQKMSVAAWFNGVKQVGLVVLSEVNIMVIGVALTEFLDLNNLNKDSEFQQIEWNWLQLCYMEKNKGKALGLSHNWQGLVLYRK